MIGFDLDDAFLGDAAAHRGELYRNELGPVLLPDIRYGPV